MRDIWEEGSQFDPPQSGEKAESLPALQADHVLSNRTGLLLSTEIFVAFSAKSLGPEPLLREAPSKIDGIEETLVFGSWADPDEMAPQDIDLVVIGDPDLGRAHDSVSGLETEVRRPTNVVVRSLHE